MTKVGVERDASVGNKGQRGTGACGGQGCNWELQGEEVWAQNVLGTQGHT